MEGEEEEKGEEQDGKWEGRVEELRHCFFFVVVLSTRNGSDRAVSPFVDALLTEAVSAGQDEVGLAVHADAALLLVGQLLHPARQTANQSQAESAATPTEWHVSLFVRPPTPPRLNANNRPPCCLRGGAPAT